MVTDEELSSMTPGEIAEFQKKNCVFCQIATEKIPAKIVYSDDDCVAVLDINPATAGHMLVMSKEHYSVMPQVPEYMLEHLSMVCKGLSQSALRALKCKGTTIFIANGVAAGQRAPHFMMHVIPRYDNDGLPLTIPARELERNEAETLTALLKKALGKKTEDAEIVGEEKTGKKTPDKKKPAKIESPKKKTVDKEGKKKEKYDLDKISEMLSHG